MIAVRKPLPRAFFARAGLGRDADRRGCIAKRNNRSIQGEGDRAGTLDSNAVYRPDPPRPWRLERLELSHFVGEV